VATGKTHWPPLLPAQKKRARLFAAREELKQITAQSEREGSLTATERAMIHNVVDFQKRDCARCDEAIVESRQLEAGLTIEDVLSVSRSTGFDRLPVSAPTAMRSVW